MDINPKSERVKRLQHEIHLLSDMLGDINRTLMEAN